MLLSLRVLWAEQRAGLSPSCKCKLVCSSSWVLSAILGCTQVLGPFKMNGYRRKRNGGGGGVMFGFLLRH